MVGSSTLSASRPRQRYAMFSSGTCSMLMTQQLRPTPGGTRFIDGMLLTCMQGLRTDHQSEAQPVITIETMNSMLSVSSPNSGPPSLTISPWTQRSTRGLGRQLQLSPVSQLECGRRKEDSSYIRRETTHRCDVCDIDCH